MIRRTTFVLVVLSLCSGPAFAECLATPCYIERVGIASCRPITEATASEIEHSGIEPERAQEILASGTGAIVRAKIFGSQPLSRCAEPDKKRLDNGPALKEYLALGASCEDFPVDYEVKGFVSSPCCDTLPIDRPECLFTLETFGPIPAWTKEAPGSSTLKGLFLNLHVSINS